VKAITARAFPNIAFIKYWGNRVPELRIPINASLSMNLAGLFTDTTVEWTPSLRADQVEINGQAATPQAAQRVSTHLDQVRNRYEVEGFARVSSHNNFPMGAGIASSASSFAALSLAATTAAGLELPERELSSLARLGSGSASRSIPPGFVEWYAGDDHESSFATSFAPANHWDLVDVVAVVSQSHKVTGSTEGHQSADTSDLQSARVQGAAERVQRCREAILNRDFVSFAEVVEHDSNLMHAVMMTSRPPLFYWLPASLTIMQKVRDWRSDGLQVCYTLDAGPNVHCICTGPVAEEVASALREIDGVLAVRVAPAGGGAHILAS
jgi:diphosphomevalonate decarboxylase